MFFNSMFYDDTKAKVLRNMYPVGTKIRLIYMDDIQAPPVGTCGTVIGVDDLGNILVEWENGSSLSLLPDKDKFQVISKPIL